MLKHPPLKAPFKKKIKNINDLPKWFNLEKYKRTNTLSEREWYEQLHVRLMSLHFLQIEECDENSIHDADNFRKALLAIRENPVVDISNNRLLRAYFYWSAECLHEVKSGEPMAALAIKQMTAHELYVLENRLTKCRGDEAKLFYSEAFSHEGFYTPKYQQQSWVNKPINEILDDYKDPQLNIRIDLTQPDTAILNQLKALLPKMRERAGVALPNKKYRSLNLEDLSTYSVLPYLDLHIWEIENKIRISDNLMIQTIYPLGEHDIDTFRKTTKSLAEKALRHDRQKFIASIAALKMID